MWLQTAVPKRRGRTSGQKLSYAVLKRDYNCSLEVPRVKEGEIGEDDENKMDFASI